MTSPFSDEQLSAVLDGLADPETVARVQASPEAAARLDQLRMVSELVATPPPAATPERRASSIAAALAAAESVAPEGVASLAVAREKAVERKRFTDRFSPQVMAAAAAILLVALITPFLIQGDDDDATIATGADTAADSISESLSNAATDDATDSGSDDSGDADSGDDMAATSLAPTADAESSDDAAMEAAPADDAMAEDEAADEEPRMFFINSAVGLLDAIDDGNVGPNLFLSDPEIQGGDVNPDCLAEFTDRAEPSFALATIESTDGPQLVVIHFGEDGTNTLFDAEDCSPVG
jgi:hypothetical protein